MGGTKGSVLNQRLCRWLVSVALYWILISTAWAAARPTRGNGEATMLRLFVGIGFPPQLKLRLSLLCVGVTGAKWVDPGNFHLTLRFIGEIGEDIAADIDDALSRLRARRFRLQIAGTGVFGGEKARSLWAAVER